MSLNAEPLRKILALEKTRDYDNSAVIGGLDKFLHNWSAQAAPSITSPPLLRRFKKLVSDARYFDKSKEERKEFLDNLLAFLSELEGRAKQRNEPPPPSQPPASTRPAPKPRTVAKPAARAQLLFPFHWPFQAWQIG